MPTISLGITQDWKSKKSPRLRGIFLSAGVTGADVLVYDEITFSRDITGSGNGYNRFRLAEGP